MSEQTYEETIKEMRRDHNLKVAAGFRKLADFVEQNAGELASIYHPAEVVYVRTKEEMAAHARMLGTANKKYDDDYLHLEKDFGGGVTFRVFTDREQVCRQVQRGTKTVVKPIFAPTEKIGEETVAVPVMEWVCDEPLLS